MQLPAQVVRSFKDIQLNFESLTRFFVQNAVATRKIQNSGSTTLTWTASTDSAVVTVPHRLGAVPGSIVATIAAIGSGQVAYPITGNADRDSFDLQGISRAAFSGTLGVYWKAIT